MGKPATIGRLGAIGDVHCEDRRLEVALRFFEEQGVDAVTCAGDVLDGEGDVDRCLALLEDHGVITVAGNHERWFLRGGRPRVVADPTEEVSPRSRAYLEGLPTTRRLPIPGGTLLLCHGVGEDDMSMLKSDTRGYALQDIPTLRELMLDPSVDIMLGGHTHERMVRVFQGLRVINCGTLRRDDDPGVALVDFAASEVAFFDVDEEAVAPAQTLRLPAGVPLPADLHY